MTTAMFTAMHYEALAQIIATAPLTPAQRQRLTKHFADWLQKDNARFDPVRFGFAVAKAMDESTDGKG